MDDDALLGRIRTAVAAEDARTLDRLFASGCDALPSAVRRALADAYGFLAAQLQEGLACRKIDPRGVGDDAEELLAKQLALDPGAADDVDALAGDILLEEAFARRKAEPEAARALAGRARTRLAALEKRGRIDAHARIALGQAILLEGRLAAAEAVARFQASYRATPQAWPLCAWLHAVEEDPALTAGFDAFRDARLAERPEEGANWAEAYLRSERPRWLAEAARAMEPLQATASWPAARAVEVGHLLERLGDLLGSAEHRRRAFAFYDLARREEDPDGFRTIYAAGALRQLGRLDEALELFRERGGADFAGDSISFGAHYLEALWTSPALAEDAALRREIEEVSRQASAAAEGAYRFPYQSLARLRLLDGDADGAIDELKRGTDAQSCPLPAGTWIDEEGLEALRGHPRLRELEPPPR